MASNDHDKWTLIPGERNLEPKGGLDLYQDGAYVCTLPKDVGELLDLTYALLMHVKEVWKDDRSVRA